MRAVPNFKMNQAAIDEGIEKAEKENDWEYLEDAAGSLMSLTRDMDVLGEKWWDYVPNEIARKFGVNLSKAQQMAANIAWTLGEAWKDDEILRERITGPIDEQELMKYLESHE
ncbi:MAG: hypothetical protein D6717_09435 [Gammaproteobacteria bacterium]|nr:MAG: hypothetical protein D6717_09435 [Gammaproteobacteria bacterium]